METQITNSDLETTVVAQKFLQKLKTNLVLLKGELGSGKTAFVKGMGKALNIKRILSPTYTIIRSYKLEQPLVTKQLEIGFFHHIDLYRLRSTHDLEILGLPEIIRDKANLVAIEWPDMFEKSLNDPRTIVSLEIIGVTKRRIRFHEALSGYDQ